MNEILRIPLKQVYDFTEMIKKSKEKIDVKVETGKATVFPIHSDGDQMSCSIVYVHAGTKFPEHTHSTFESFVLYEGSLSFKTENFEQEFKSPANFYVDANVSHSAYFKENSILVVINIPADRDFQKET